jgi:TPR repeat protein
MAENKEYSDAVAAYHAGEYERAFVTLLSHAEAGHSEAQCIIGSMYNLGLGRPADISQAMQWYLRSAEQGYGAAANNIATLFLGGRYGGAPDKLKARQWYERARAMGFEYSPRVD